ncbi:PEP-CTERM sorting domain-containing protein [Sulfuriroseicoccus oceanibius]|uniref:PEP-CTERM sorting domain-containing protein n=1 Tax=Sulfuriroseicoccus oceanibius TaxID=2707525 RepID=UPI001F33F3AE|nr:PEP-CTERM sorting domain-containing protein [Sulfuriroseicoccus oceanibius]
MRTKIPHAIALGLGMLGASHAAMVITPTSITYTGTNPDSGLAGLDDESALIDGSGLSEPLTVDNIDFVTHANPVFSAPGNAWTTTDPGGGGSDFFASTLETVVFEIVFDQGYTLDTFYNWSYDFDEGAGNGNNIRTVNIEYGIGDFLGGSLTDVNFTTTENNFASTADLGGINADRLRITVTDNFFGEAGIGGGDRVSAAEFAFIGDNVGKVPEPSSAALLGLGGLAMILRRRK